MNPVKFRILLVIGIGLTEATPSFGIDVTSSANSGAGTLTAGNH
jgi:hypothetical protein